MLSKKDRENHFFVGAERGLSSKQLVTAEQASFSSKNGFSPELAALGQELSAKANKLKEMKAKGKRFPRIEQTIKHEIEHLIKQITELGAQVEDLGGGAYWVTPPKKTTITITLSSEASDANQEEPSTTPFNFS